MSEYIPEESLVIDLTAVLFPKHRQKKAARTAVEFILESYFFHEDPAADIGTLRRFVDFMIQRGYN